VLFSEAALADTLVVLRAAGSLVIPSTAEPPAAPAPRTAVIHRVISRGEAPYFFLEAASLSLADFLEDASNSFFSASPLRSISTNDQTPVPLKVSLAPTAYWARSKELFIDQ
jgi:hypothetical protein